MSYEELRDEIDALRATYRELENDVHWLRTTNDELRAKNRRLREEIRAALKEVERVGTENEELREEIHGMAEDRYAADERETPPYGGEDDE